VINKLFDGFDGKLKSSKWAKIAKCSPDTALRDIKDLIEKVFYDKNNKGDEAQIMNWQTFDLQPLPHPLLTIPLNQIPHPAEFIHYFLLGACGLCRVRKIMMEFFSRRRKIRATLVGIVANGNYKVKVQVGVFIHIVTGVVADVYTIFFHNGNGAGVYTVRFNTGTKHFCFVAGKKAQVAFGKLAAATVAGAEDENFFHGV
jgi:hypothetical protein